MKRQLRKVLAVLMALAICVSTVNLDAYAAEAGISEQLQEGVIATDGNRGRTC